jgi:hypothetical protein
VSLHPLVSDAAPGVTPQEDSNGFLVNLPPTAEIRADLGRARARSEGRGVEYLTDRLARAEERDHRVSQRRRRGPEYADCWCLGEGGRGEYVVGIETAPGVLTAQVRLGDGSVFGPIYAYRDYCPCPDGRDALMDQSSKRMELRGAYGDHTRRLLAEDARIPSIYDGCTPSSWVREVTRRGVQGGDAVALTETIMDWSAGHRRGDPNPRPATLLLAGGYGTGKTALAAWVGRVFLDEGRSVIMRKAAEILAELRAAPWRAREQGLDEPPMTELRILKQATDADLFILDDLGAEALVGAQADRAVEALLLMLDGRLNRDRPTIVTTNVTATTLIERVGGRIVDRLMGGVTSKVVVFRNPSLRKADW